MSNPPTRASQRSNRTTAGRKPVRKGWRRFFSWKPILLTLLGLFLIGAAAFGVAYASTNVPQPNDLANAQASIVYYSDGKSEMARISEINRESVPLTQIPLHVQRALLAAEDRTFYQNSGVSPSGIARAVIVALKGGPTQGGSTITQQYVKNYFLTQDRTVSRKLKEFIISIKIDQQESKNKILENYLNTIYYGRGAYGIQTAARAYFGVDASKLTVAQGALLASVIRGPAFYDPALGASQKANATARVNYVLDGMVTEGWLSPAERAKTTFPKTLPRSKPTKAGTVGYIVNEVRLELTNKLGLTATDIDRGGLRIVTTINRQAQAAAVKAVNEYMPSERDAPRLHVGLTAIKPGDGAIVAMYGGKDYSKVQFNDATQATMQGGSTFKVFGLLAALQKDISTKTTFDGHSPQYFPQFASPTDPRGKVPNFGGGSGEQFGRIDLRKATAHSVNTVFAQLNIKLADGGTKATALRDAAILAGLPKNTSGLSINMNNILGTASAARHRHGQRLRDHRRSGTEGDAVPHQQGDVRRRQHQLQGQEGAVAGLRQEGDSRRHGGHDTRRDRGHRHRGTRSGSPGCRQDRYDGQDPVGLVRRLHPAAVGCGRDLQGQCELQVERDRPDHPEERRPDLQWRYPGRYLDRLHEGGSAGAEGPLVPAPCGSG